MMILSIETTTITDPPVEHDEEREIKFASQIEKAIAPLFDGKIVSFWLGIPGDEPALHISINGELACLDYFDTDETYYSFVDRKPYEPTVILYVAGDIVEVGRYRIISKSAAIKAAEKFFETQSIPVSIAMKKGLPIL